MIGHPCVTDKLPGPIVPSCGGRRCPLGAVQRSAAQLVAIIPLQIAPVEIDFKAL